jgi:UPF0271 protein
MAPNRPHADDLVERFGDAAIRARLDADLDGPALLAALRQLPGVIDAVVTERHALVTCVGPVPASLETRVAEAIARTPRSATAATGALHTIRVRYDGEDLESVARASSLDVDAVIAAHTLPVYTVAAIGFLPGFAYLRGLDPRLVLPRRATPRARVPALSVAIAGPYAGVYPFASPGGWHLLGTAVGFVPFDPARGAAFALGDRVNFEP